MEDFPKYLLDLGKNCSSDLQNFPFCDRNDGLNHIVQVSLFMLSRISQIKKDSPEFIENHFILKGNDKI